MIIICYESGKNFFLDNISISWKLLLLNVKCYQDFNKILDE